MDREKICSLIGKKYLLKNRISCQDDFLKGSKTNSYDSYNLYDFINSTSLITDYEKGIFLRLTTAFLLTQSRIKSQKDLNNFIERVSSVNLEEYIKLIKTKQENTLPIKYEALNIQNSEKCLRQKSTKIKLDDEYLTSYIAILENYCQNDEILAISAIQLGIPKRIIYLKNTNLELIARYQNKTSNNYNELRIILNPQITKQTGLAEYWEACASCLDNLGHVYRPYEIEMEYYDINKKKHKQIFKGFEATILSHEYDHLDGILFIDKADIIKHKNAQERKEFRKTHNYNIIFKTGDYLSLMNKIKNKKEGEVKNE